MLKVFVKFVINPSLMVRVFLIRELRSGGAYYLSTCEIIFRNRSELLLIEKDMVFNATFNNSSVRS